MSSASPTGGSSAFSSDPWGYRVLKCSMNAGGTDAAPTIAGPGLTFAPVIAIGAPTISAEAMATTATARATIDKSALRHGRCFFDAPGALEKTPRLRDVRAARVGGNRGGKPKSKSCRVVCECRSSLPRSRAIPAVQCGRPVRTRRATRLSMLVSIIPRPEAANAFPASTNVFSVARGPDAAADSVPPMSNIHVDSPADGRSFG